MAKAKPAKGVSVTAKAEKTIELLTDIEKEYHNYERIKALSSIPFSSFRNVLLSEPRGSETSVVEVLTPFIEGTRARMDNIRPIVNSMNFLLDQLNDYLLDKIASFDVLRGFKLIESDTQRAIALEWLSSGERQILFMFCTVFLMRDTPSILMIDEPELSLNMKWQRKIVPSLLNMVRDSNVQFIFASHSFEILSKYQKNISKLVSHNK